jgi:hypothetical protein
MPEPIPLSRPVKPIDCPALTTLEGACEYMLALPKRVVLQTHWQNAARLWMAARERPSVHAIADLTEQLELALMLSFRLDVSADKRSAARSSKAHLRIVSPRSRSLGVELQ